MGSFLQNAVVDTAASGNVTVVAGVTGKRIAVYGYTIVNGATTAQTVQFKSGTTVLSGAMSLSQAAGPLVVQAGPSSGPLFVTVATGDALIITTSAATQVSGHVGYQYV